MKITQSKDAIQVAKPQGVNVRYYLFQDYVVHYVEQAPHTTQTWHHHEIIWETLYIIDGELIAYWREGGEEKSQPVGPGDLIETERSPHTFVNESDSTVRFLVVKRISSGGDYTETFKTDKVLD